MGNITSIKENGTVIESYTYDSLNQLKTVTRGSDVWEYTYDNGGNILSVKKNGVVEKSYTYGDTEWKDLLTNYNGTNITYDAIGNPLSYRGGMSFTWADGRKLTAIAKGTDNISYTYDANGLRNSKTVNGTATEYYWLNGILQGQKTGSEYMIFLHDENGTAYGFMLKNGTTREEYYYIFNAQGDVIGILDSHGTQVVKYTYNAWGELLSTTGTQAETIGAKNPIRYRGYYYDSETGFYYVSSRYYDPEIGRWINADSQLNTSLGVLGLNQFSYCLNNPVNMVDYGGNKPGDLFDTMDEAARDFAEYINAKSIADNREYASYIYEVKVKTTVRITVPVYKILKIPFLPKWLTIKITGTTTKTKYTYAKPKKGTKAGVVLPIMGYVFVSNKVALLHTHGKYLEEYGSGNDHFSPEDKQTAKFFKIPFYVATPLGTLRRYDPLTQSDVPLFDDLPYDKSHPRR